MDATNRQIIAQLADIATAFFASLEVEPGTYTAAELAANVRTGDKQKRPIYALPELPKENPTEEQISADLYNNEAMTVAAGSFVCEFPRLNVFAILWKFEQMERVSQKEKTRFVREKESNGVTFYINVPKEAKNVVKFADTDGMRPALEQIFLDVEKSALVASDTHILGEYLIGVEGSPELPEGCPAIRINPKHMKNLTGCVRVNVDKDSEANKYIATFTNEAGEIFVNDLNTCCFPDYRRVYPGQLSTDGYLQLTPKSVKVAQQLFKSLKKDNCQVLAFSVESGSTTAKVKYTNECTQTSRETTLELCAPAAVSLAVGLNPEFLTNALAGWNGGMWIMDPSRPIVFDCKGTRAVVVMPVFCGYLPEYTTVKGEISTMERTNYISVDNEPSEPKKRATKQITDTLAKVSPAEPATPEESESSDADVIEFIEQFTGILDNIVKLVYRAEISKTLERLQELATLAGVDILDMLAEAVPVAVAEVVEPVINAAEVESAAMPADAVDSSPIAAETTPVEVAMPAAPASVVNICRGSAPPGLLSSRCFGQYGIRWRSNKVGSHRIRDGTTCISLKKTLYL